MQQRSEIQAVLRQRLKFVRAPARKLNLSCSGHAQLFNADAAKSEAKNEPGLTPRPTWI